MSSDHLCGLLSAQAACILDHDFARIACERCKAEFLVAFSCKTRYLCPSCPAKRLEIWAD